jgi:hypothetical protein
VYLTRFLGACFRVLEGCFGPAEGRLALQKLALEPVSLPGERGFPLEGLFEKPETRGAADLLRAWLAQARAEAGLRLLTLFYTPSGKQSPFWLDVARKSRKFFVVFETYRQPVEEEAIYKRNTTSSRSTEYKLPQDTPVAAVLSSEDIEAMQKAQLAAQLATQLTHAQKVQALEL